MKNYILIVSTFFLFCCAKTPNQVVVDFSVDPVQYGTAFTKVPAAKDAIIYQVNIRAFSTAGNLQGVTARLDSIKSLGINVLYLMPVYPVGSLRGFNSPYAIKDYKAVGAEFGTLEDLRALVNGAHSRNMAVMMDWVANHTAWDNVWINNKTWYQQDASGNIINPPGYSDVAQLNYNNDEMRTAMIEAMRYWIFTANIDGYRCDFADNVPFSFWKQAVNSLKSIKGRQVLMFAEGTRNDHFNAGFDFIFGFGFYYKMKEIYAGNKSVTAINDINTSEYINANDSSQVIRYITNHDVNGSDGTPLEMFGGKNGAMAAFVVTALMKGVPMIYSGQEVGTAYRLTFPFTAQKINWESSPDVTAEYKKLLAFRSSNAAIRGGQLYVYSSDDVVAFIKQLNKEKNLVLVNLRNRAIAYTLPASIANTIWTDALNGGNISLTADITLQPYSYLILKNQ